MIHREIQIAMDVVVFSFRQAEGIRVLLCKRRSEPFKHRWALPGGSLQYDESLERGVQRILESRTMIKATYMEQLHTFGKPDRDPRGRIISIAYMAIAKPERINLAEDESGEIYWYNIRRIPDLAFDHRRIIQAAIVKLKNKIWNDLLCFEMLEAKFLFSDLEILFNSLQDKPVERRNFRKKVLSFGILEELQDQIVGRRGRPAIYYRFNRTKYFELRDRGYNFYLPQG